MVQGNNIFAFMGKFKDSNCAKIINFERLFNRISETDTCGRIEDNFCISGYLFIYLWIHTEVLLHKIAFNSYHTLIYNLTNVRPAFEKRLEQLGAEDFFV